jgi:hypothetical protein
MLAKPRLAALQGHDCPRIANLAGLGRYWGQKMSAGEKLILIARDGQRDASPVTQLDLGARTAQSKRLDIETGRA